MSLNKWNSDDYTPVTEVMSHPYKFGIIDLLNWCKQVANGMDYLFKNKILHCDLGTND